MNAEMLTASITAVAIALAEGNDTEEIELLAAVLTQLGDTLATIAAVRGRSEG